MIVYSVTVSIDSQIESEWLSWMKSHHIPEVISTGHFIEYHFQRLLNPAPDPGTSTFNIQYICKSMNEFLEYQANWAPALQAAHSERYKDRFAAFRTILERI